MKILKIFLLFFVLLQITACDDKTNDSINPIKKENIGGVIQKGPFINGSTVSIAELNSELAPTGRKFDAQIMNNSGLFNIKNIELESQYAELKADGFYFNEVHGVKSSSQLTLYSLSDLSDKNTVNVNILSHLERGRMLYLIDKGSSFQEAKQQARTEVLKIFGIDPDESVDEFDGLDISKTGTGNAILLAASVILQGNRDTANLSELLADILTDIRSDGTLDSTATILKIVTDLEVVKLSNVRENLEKRYKELSIDYSIPEFEKYVQAYLNSKRDYTLQIPEEGKHGKNLLYYLVNFEELDEMINDGCFHIDSGSYSVNATIPEDKELIFFAGAESQGTMQIEAETIEGWTETETDPEYTYSMKFKSYQESAEMKFEFLKGDTFLRIIILDKGTGETIREWGHCFRIDWDPEQHDELHPEEPYEEEDDNEEHPDENDESLDNEQPDEQPDEQEPTPTSINFPENGSHGTNLIKIIYDNAPASTIELEEGVYSLYVESPFDAENMTQNELIQSAVSISFQGSTELMLYHTTDSFGWYYRIENENVQYFSINAMYNDAKVEYKGGNYKVTLTRAMSTMTYNIVPFVPTL